MALPVTPPVAPMLAKSRDEIPRGPGWRYEPKWDGFRAIVFRDGDDVHIGSRGGKPLQRYFPELLPVLRDALPDACVVDGEIVLPLDGVLEFETLQHRIHPAASRIHMLSEETPTTFVAFDLVALGPDDLRGHPLAERWDRLVEVFPGRPATVKEIVDGAPTARLTPQTRDPDEAGRWLRDLEPVGLDGVIAKQDDLLYRPGDRVMVKVKRRKSADCVVGGYRMAKDGDGVGSLLLGLYDADGELRHVGFTSSFRKRERREVLEHLRPHEGESSFGLGGGPGGPSRWRSQEAAWTPLEPRLVVEVAYDHIAGHRFRHGTTFLRWRTDKPPRECTLDQLR